jgi:hypothetical protein
MLFVVILLALVILVIVRHHFIDHFNVVMGELEIENGRRLMSKNKRSLQDTKIDKEILDKIIGNMVNKELNTENDSPEEGDIDTKILNQSHKIFTDMTNNKILLKNLKFELKKLVNSNKPIDVIKLSYEINNKNN